MIEPVRLVVCRRDVRTSRRLAAANHPTHGPLVCSATPANEGLAPITRALLEALGKNPRLTGGATASATRGWPLVAVWLQAQAVRDVVIDEAQLLPAAVAEQVVLLAAGLGLRLWLVAHPPLGDVQPAVLDAWPTIHTDTTALEAMLHSVQPAAGSPNPASPTPGRSFPTVPDVDTVFFLSACRDLLAPADFAVVRDRFVAAAERAGCVVDARREGGGSLTAVPLLIHLRHQVLDAGSPDEMLTVLRGAATALLPVGWLLSVNVDRFRATVAGEAWFLARSNPDWAALAGYRQPYRAAACALAHAGLTVAEIAALRCADLAADGTAVSVAGTTVATTPAGRVFLRAQRLSRAHDGAGPDEPLFVTEAGRPASERYIREAITEPTVEAGVELTRGRVAHRRPTPLAWARRLGIKVEQWN